MVLRTGLGLAVYALAVWGATAGAEIGRAPMTVFAPEDLHPPAALRVKSPGKTTYFVDPINGDDARSGLSRDQAWRTFRPVNARFFSTGDRVEVIAPGTFRETLMPMGEGTAEAPVEIRFVPGRYDFLPTEAVVLPAHQIDDHCQVSVDS